MAQGTTKGVPIDVDPLLDLDSDLVVPSQKAIKAYVDAKQSQADSDYVNVSGDTMTGYLLLHADPSTNLHAVTKQYVDNYINGLDYKTAAHVGTVQALPAYTVSVNKLVLTGTANGAIPTATFDGHDPLVGERVLIKNESSSANNGIYVVTQVGTGSLPFILARSADADTSSEIGEATLSIIYGNTLSNTIWHCTPASVPITLGTTGLTFIQVGSGSVGTGVANELTYWASTSSLGSLTGNITTTKKFLSQTGDGTITSSPVWGTLTSSDVGLGNVENTALSTWAGSANITTLGTITTGTWSAGTIAVARGGTGLTTIAAKSILVANSLDTYTTLTPAAGQSVRINAGGTAWEVFTPGSGGGVTTVGTFSGSSQTNGASISGVTITFGPADGTNPGMVSTGTQTWAGAKTLSSALTITPTSNQLVLGTTNTTTISATNAGGAKTYTIPNVGTTSNFLMSTGTQSFSSIFSLTQADTTVASYINFAATTDPTGNVTHVNATTTGNTYPSGMKLLFRTYGTGYATYIGRSTNISSLLFACNTGGRFEFWTAYTENIRFTNNTISVDNGSGTLQQVISARKTGWTAATGTAQRTTFATDTVTLINLARAVKALIDDLISHGLIGT